MSDDIQATLRDLVTFERGLRGDCNRCIEIMRETGTVSPEQIHGVITELRRLDGVIRRAVETLVGGAVEWDD